MQILALSLIFLGVKLNHDQRKAVCFIILIKWYFNLFIVVTNINANIQKVYLSILKGILPRKFS
jgi:hypothetical protein